MRASHESYIDSTDADFENVTIEKWIYGTEFYIECDIWIGKQFNHVFDPSKPMTNLPDIGSLPRSFYFRVIAIRGE